jgi:hypothetical protein
MFCQFRELAVLVPLYILGVSHYGFSADMHSMMEGEDGVEPHDVFVDLGVLIVEGRIPGGAWAAGRGYGEGPHCAGVGISALPVRHDCDPNNNFLVSVKLDLVAYLICDAV